MNLRAIRLARGFTQTDLAKAANLAQSAICDYEQGKKRPGLVAINRLCNALGCTADELLGRKPPREAS